MACSPTRSTRLPLPKASQSAILASALTKLQSHYRRSLRATAATAPLLAAPTPVPPPAQQHASGTVTSVPSLAVRDSAYTPFFALLRQEHQAGPLLPAACEPAVPHTAAPSPARLLGLHYAHNPYSFDGPVWLALSATNPSSLAGAASHLNCRMMAM
eukprot:EG_transcript_14105